VALPFCFLVFLLAQSLTNGSEAIIATFTQFTVTLVLLRTKTLLRKSTRSNMSTVVKHYKIRDRRTGLYSKGGDTPSWSKTGKTWTTMGGLMNHLGYFRKNYYNWDGKPDTEEFLIPETWELVEIEVRLDETPDFLRSRKPKAKVFVK
jgi:hypothetical protein